MSGRELIRAEQLTVNIGGNPVLKNLSFTIMEDEQWIITGASGTGKTTLLKLLAGQQYHQGRLYINGSENHNKRIVLVEQQHHFKNRANVSNFYYQQRFNSSDSEDTITVSEDLDDHRSIGQANEKELEKVITLLGLTDLLDERLIKLSNGENKRLQIAKALLDQPEILLLDNPFVGLDTNARSLLKNILREIVSQGVQVIAVTSSVDAVDRVSHVLVLERSGSFSIVSANEFTKKLPGQNEKLQLNETLLSELLHEAGHQDFQTAVRMQDVRIVYDGHVILDSVNWTIRSGECWSLSGPNGAGKSTLLSLITADNPQAYANDIHLFDRKRGSGETIWEIKRKIGYISPELHLHFDQSNTGFEVVASGLFDTIGLFRQLNDEQVALVNQWMQLLDLTPLRNKYLSQLSASQQRMVLLARALVKNPPMLVLDEPCQGLDELQVNAFRHLVNEICTRGNKTLIYVSHYTEELPACVNKFLRLESGRVVP